MSWLSTARIYSTVKKTSDDDDIIKIKEEYTILHLIFSQIFSKSSS